MSPIIYLHGFASSPLSTKARFFREKFAGIGVSMEIPDLAQGEFESLTITGQLEVVAKAVAGRTVTLMGSSLGGYLAALYAARNPEVERLVLMAPAFGFARRWPETLGDDVMKKWRDTGTRLVFHYGEGTERPLSYKLIDDAMNYEEFPDVTQPGLILHGTKDEVVPVSLSRQFARNRPNVKLVELASDHELTDVTGRLWLETVSYLPLAGGFFPQA